MFMNMNFEWIASFPARDNYCVLLRFPRFALRVVDCNQACSTESTPLPELSHKVSYFRCTSGDYFTLGTVRYCGVYFCIVKNNCIGVEISAFFYNRGRSWSVTLGWSSDTRPHGSTARQSNAAE